MSDRPHITDEELHAYIDGELSPVRAADILALSQYDRTLADKIAAFKGDKAQLAALYGPIAQQPVPAAWLHTIERAQQRRPFMPPPRGMWAMAASIALIIVGVIAFETYRPTGEDAVVAEAMAARHDSMLMTGAVGNAPSLESATATVKEALGPAVKAPDLSRLGYTLAAAHGLPEHKGVTIDYRDARGRVFTVYLSRSNGKERFDMLKRGPTRICIWQDEELSAVMVGEMSAGEMLRLATLAYTGLSAA